MRDTNDGFVVARRDLELRGPGELLGTRQTGLAQMRVADLAARRRPAAAVQIAAERLLRDWPTHVAPLVRRWVGHGGAVRPRRVECAHESDAKPEAR